MIHVSIRPTWIKQTIELKVNLSSFKYPHSFGRNWVYFEVYSWLNNKWIQRLKSDAYPNCAEPNFSVLGNQLLGSIETSLEELMEDRLPYHVNKNGSEDFLGFMHVSVTVLNVVSYWNELTNGSNKLLLLGTGQSGKSALFRSVKLACGKRIDDITRSQYRESILTNCVKLVQYLVKQYIVEKDVANMEQSLVSTINKLRTMKSSQTAFLINELLQEQTMVINIETLWRSLLRRIWNRNRFLSYSLNDGSNYFLDNFKKFYDNGTLTNDMHLIMAQCKTTGVDEITLKHKGKEFKIADTGGQRTERRKWFPCYRDTYCILYVVNLAEYPFLLYEDEETYRTKESMQTFSDVVNNYCSSLPILLIFTHCDEFKRYLPEIGLQCAYQNVPEHLRNANADYTQALQFVVNQYLSVIQSDERREYIRQSVRVMNLFEMNESRLQITDMLDKLL